jgi:hypothetical protein
MVNSATEKNKAGNRTEKVGEEGTAILNKAVNKNLNSKLPFEYTL